jgi:DNA (cytosine-5)-methyltransferase 1
MSLNTNKLRVFEAFAGYGGGSFALKKAYISHKIVGFSEINKTAIKCYHQNHKNTINYGDITRINPFELPDFDLFIGGFCCQSFSVSGKGLGEDDKRGTLYLDIIRIVEVKQPIYVLLENVKGLTNKKHKHTFDKIISELERLNYEVCWSVLNSKDYGIPQNRERVYIICYNEKITKHFRLPQKVKLKLSVRDILEANRINPIINNKRLEDIIKSGYKKDKTLCFELKGITPSGVSKQFDRIYDLDKWCNTLNCTQSEYLFYDKKNSDIVKLTPRECFRLMGFLKDEIDLSNISDNQIYKLAGNGFDINIVALILHNLLK